MSRRRTGRVRTTALRGDRPTSAISVEAYDVDQGLFDKRAKTREEALSKILEVLTNDMHNKITETRFGTIMLRCVNSVKKGSAKEICLATRVLGLLALNIGPGDNAYELYEESLSMFSQPLKFIDEFEKVFICLAVSTFVGAKDFLDTERSLKVVWEFLKSNLSSKKLSQKVLVAAISSWTFLLTTIDGWRLDHKHWQGVLCYLLNLLGEGGDVCAVCVEALVIIFEKGNVEKFSNEAYSLIQEDPTSSLQEWKAKVLHQVKKACNPNWKVLQFFEDNYKFETSMNIHGNILKFSTFSKLKKIKFLKQFLGVGFEMHMLENELLKRVFNFIPKEVSSGPELYEPEIEEFNIRYFSPDIRREKCKQRFERSSNSPASKAKTQFLKKQRILAQERKGGSALEIE